MSAKNIDRLVYSSDHGRLCDKCAKPIGDCVCNKSVAAPAGDGTVRVRREVKGRGGKSVTVITGIPLAGKELKAFAKKLKARCASGGTIKDGTIEIQGDHCDLMLEELLKMGWTVKRAGG